MHTQTEVLQEEGKMQEKWYVEQTVLVQWEDGIKTVEPTIQL